MTIPQYNIDADKLEAALSEKTKAVMIAHTLGNPFDLQKVKNSVTVITCGWWRTTVMPSEAAMS